MGLRDKYKQATGASGVGSPDTGVAHSAVAIAEVTLAEMRARIAAGKTGGVNPPEAADAPLSVAPKTGPNGESLTEASSEKTTAIAQPVAETAAAKRGRKPASAAVQVEARNLVVSGMWGGIPFSFVATLS